MRMTSEEVKEFWRGWCQRRGHSKEIVAAGGHVIAQDEETSVVWGMPGQVTNAGLCSAVLPLPEIGGRITRLFTGERQ